MIATKFCTWHDSCAVVACAKVCSNNVALNGITTKWIVPEILIVSEKSLVTCVRFTCMSITAEILCPPQIYGHMNRMKNEGFDYHRSGKKCSFRKMRVFSAWSHYYSVQCWRLSWCILLWKSSRHFSQSWVQTIGVSRCRWYLMKNSSDTLSVLVRKILKKYREKSENFMMASGCTACGLLGTNFIDFFFLLIDFFFCKSKYSYFIHRKCCLQKWQPYGLGPIKMQFVLLDPEWTGPQTYWHMMA